MKGKGKNPQPTMERSESKESLSECPLQFPDLKPVEHVRMCPRYTAVLGRSDTDDIGIEEVDILQTEIETLLAAVAKRMRLLETEIAALAGMQQESNKPAVAVAATPQRPDKGKGKSLEGKRSLPKSEEKPSKKFKESSGKATLPPTPARNSKGKGQQTPKLEVPERSTDSPKPPAPPQPKELPKVPKNDAPNRFWALVEPYCADLAIDDLRVLEDLLRSHEDESIELHKIPNLGKHYSHKWSQEDLQDEQREGSKPGKGSGKSLGSDGISLMKKASGDDRKSSAFPLPLDLHGDDNSSPFGPLTQRLVSALIEENIMTPLEDANIDVDAAEAATMSPRSLAKQLNIGNTAQLERRIRRELEEQGILDTDERPDDSPDDEILAELRRKQRELTALSQQNHMQTKRMYKLAKDEMTRQELKRKMAVADADVIECLRKIQAAKQKKRVPTKKERDTATKAMKERETIIQQLEDLG